jgi:hypothetical protein
VIASWVAFLRVKDSGAARKLLFRIQEALDMPIELGEVEQYWKDTSLYRCTFTTAINAVDSPRAVHEVLAAAGRLAPGWHVNNLPPTGPFEGWTDGHIVVAGVTSLGFSLSAEQC